MLHSDWWLTSGNRVTKRRRFDLQDRFMKTSIPFGCILALLLVGLVSCDKKSGEAVVLAKEHIAAALPAAETPNAQSAASPDGQLRPMANDEIAVDGYVMKPEVRGTSRDPRALSNEQWLVKVRMLDNGRTFQIQADQAQWQKLRENDRVKISYHVGTYTGTVWGAEIK